MVDACIGGKTGIDFGGVKNSVGHVHYALESYCIFPFLKTLKYQELISGFSEVIKAAMLFDGDLLKQIQKLPIKFECSRDWFIAVSRGAELKAMLSVYYNGQNCFMAIT
jgi:3-dehydroquinate synthetase